MSSQYVDIVSSYEDIDVCEQENNEELKEYIFDLIMILYIYISTFHHSN